ncbi:phage tail protein, partial [Enterobacter hormaechei subsp. xiangfangensis]|nr:phage tail protein [Enterobacter hormaechei subsp. xiangfangensis]MCW6043649.1 phage tail protein [Enterobacter hormaechei subsp. xiangfangensis]MCW6048382.1 phage tail protein [Enterobacter hormaechei subsp. xiangfangensis]
MATTPTNLPVPSESPRDLKFNAGKIDEFVTSLVNTYVDRFGNEHYTIEGLRWLAQQAIAQYGWIPVGTFQDGATLTLPNQILKDTTDGSYYRWDGDLPKTVPSGSTPSTSGGTGVGAWLSVGDSTLRSMLAAPGGDKLIGSSWGGASVWEDYPYKGSVKPSKVIYP